MGGEMGSGGCWTPSWDPRHDLEVLGRLGAALGVPGGLWRGQGAPRMLPGGLGTVRGP